MSRRLNILAALVQGMGGAPQPYFLMDTVTNTYKANGVTYASEAAMNTALGITKTGEARTSNGYSDPAAPNLLLNPLLDVDASNWTTSPSGATVSSFGGHGRVQSNGVTSGTAIQLVKTIKRGKGYKLSGNVGKVTGTGSATLRMGRNIGFSVSDAFFSTPSAFPQLQVGYMGACVESGHYFGFGGNGVSDASGDYYGGNLSLVENVPYPGYVSESDGKIVTFTTPASFVGTQVMWQDGNTSEVDRQRIQTDASGICSFIAGAGTVTASTTMVTQTLGTLSPSTDYSVWIGNGPNRVAVRLGAGGTIYSWITGEARNASKNGTGVPAVSRPWIGRSPTGETFAGVIKKIARYPIGIAAAPVWVLVGNSLAGLGAGSSNDTGIANSYYGSNGYQGNKLAQLLGVDIYFCSYGGAGAGAVRTNWNGMNKATFTGYISDGAGGAGTILTVTSVDTEVDGSGVIGTGQSITSRYIDTTISGTPIVGTQITGTTGGVGTYNLTGTGISQLTVSAKLRGTNGQAFPFLAPFAAFLKAKPTGVPVTYVIGDMPYNGVAGAPDADQATTQATSAWTATLGQLNDIRAIDPDAKFMILGARRNRTDVEFRTVGGTPGFKAAATDLFDSLASTYCTTTGAAWAKFCPMAEPLSNTTKALAWAGASPTAQDLIDESYGVPCQSLTTDGVHDNPLGGTGTAQVQWRTAIALGMAPTIAANTGVFGIAA